MSGGAASPPPPADGDASPPLSLPPAGRFLLAYEIMGAPLGSGAFGSVVSVRRRTDGARFVAKVSRAAVPDAARAAMDEVRALNALSSCPYVVKIVDAFLEESKKVIVVMEAARAGDAAAWLAARSTPVPDTASLSIFAQILAALAASHAVGIVHRDVKLANVLLREAAAARGVDGPPGRVALADFGLSTARSSHATLAGTPACMAPETLAGGAAGPPADVWAAGIALWTLMAGRPPYHGESVASLAARVVSGPVPRLPDGMGGPDVRALLDVVLVKDPAARPTAAALLEWPVVAAALRAVEGGATREEKEAPPPPPPPATTIAEEKGSVAVAPSTAGEEDAAALAALVALQHRMGVRV